MTFSRLSIVAVVSCLVLAGAASEAFAQFQGGRQSGDDVTDSWKANLDRECEPDDPVDAMRAWLTPETFWAEQKRLFVGMHQGAKNNVEHTAFLLKDNKEGRGEFYQEVRKRADELGYGREDVQAMIKENMARYDALAKTFKKNMELQRREMNWLKRCLRIIDSKLRELGLPAEPVK